MSLKDGTAIALVGRRRRACYARVKITKMKKSSCTVSFNLAHNLRLRSGDKIKIVPLRKEGDEEEEFSGDMAILKPASQIVQINADVQLDNAPFPVVRASFLPIHQYLPT